MLSIYPVTGGQQWFWSSVGLNSLRKCEESACLASSVWPLIVPQNQFPRIDKDISEATGRCRVNSSLVCHVSPSPKAPILGFQSHFSPAFLSLLFSEPWRR
eukprot:g11575.t1